MRLLYTYWRRKQGVLENAIGSGVHIYDIGTRGEHGDNAVSLVCYLSRIIHNLWKPKKSRGKKRTNWWKLFKILKGLCTFYPPTWAPSSCTSLQDSGNTSVAMTGYPCFSKFFAIGFPILPKPINPTWVFEAIDLEETITAKCINIKTWYPCNILKDKNACLLINSQDA